MSSPNSKIDHKIDPADFRKQLITWYQTNKRALPWRYEQNQKTDPYRVWLSEIMLQQTVVKAVIPYFEKFTHKWKTIQDLANASQEEVTDAWAGLGYYSRVRNLHKCAKQIILEHDGIFPSDEKTLLKLSGVGAYTASAIRSIAYNKPANIVDGNIERVIARVFALKKPLKEVKKDIRQKSQTFIGEYEGQHSSYSQSLMELGALICTPTSPKCETCPISTYCESNQKGIQNELPIKAIKTKKPIKYGYAYIVLNNKDMLVERREEKGLLGGTIGLPTSEWKKNKSELQHLDFTESDNHIKYIGDVKHVFTHFELYLKVYSLNMESNRIGSNQFYWINQDKLKSDLPSVFKKVYNIYSGVKK